jgi:hypothetical protein
MLPFPGTNLEKTSHSDRNSYVTSVYVHAIVVPVVGPVWIAVVGPVVKVNAGKESNQLINIVLFSKIFKEYRYPHHCHITVNKQVIFICAVSMTGL